MLNFWVLPPTLGADRMFTRMGFSCYRDKKPDLIVFCGGTDISPSIYGESLSPFSQNPDTQRDEEEIRVFKEYPDVPKLGICRGAQLLCALHGGSLYQHVTGHEYGTHMLISPFFHYLRVPSSTVHHQMMRLPQGSDLIAWTFSENQKRWNKGKWETERIKEPEIAVVGNSLLVQGHPEFGPSEFTEAFFILLTQFLKKF